MFPVSWGLAHIPFEPLLFNATQTEPLYLFGMNKYRLSGDLNLSRVPLKMHTLLISAPYFALSRENTATGIGSIISQYYR